MAASLAVAIAVTFIVAFALLGRTTDSRTVSAGVVGGLPLMAVSAGGALAVGFTFTSAVAAMIAIFVGYVLAAALGPVRQAPLEGRAVAGAISWAATGLVTLVLAGLLLSWSVNLIAAFTTLNSVTVAVILGVAAAATAYGKRAGRGLARVVLILIIVGAVLLLAAGFGTGKIQYLSDHALAVDGLSPAGTIVYGVSIAVVAAGSAGVRKAAERRKRTVISGAVLAVITGGGLIGLVMLMGGAIQTPSVPMETIVAYIPPAVGAVIAAIIAIAGVVGTAFAINSVIVTSDDVRAATVPALRSPLRSLIACAGLGLITLVIALAQPNPQWAVPFAAVIAVVGIAVERRGAARAPSTAAPAPELDPV